MLIYDKAGFDEKMSRKEVFPFKIPKKIRKSIDRVHSCGYADV